MLALGDLSLATINKRKRKHCQKRECRALDCGKCSNCVDKKKFGGPELKRQRCSIKVCPHESQTNIPVIVPTNEAREEPVTDLQEHIDVVSPTAAAVVTEPDNCARNISSLPPELLMTILGKLSYRDLCTALLVCRQWRDCGGQPLLWRGFLRSSVFPEDVAGLLAVPRLARVTRLVVKHDAKQLLEVQPVSETERAPKFRVLRLRRVLNENLCEILRPRSGLLAAVSELDISHCDVTRVDPVLLGEFLNNMRKLRLVATQFTGEQLQQFCIKMENYTNIAQLELNLKSVEATKTMEPETLGNGLNNIETLTIHQMDKQFMMDQSSHFFAAMGRKTKIRSLTLKDSDFPTVSREELAAGLTAVEELSLVSVGLKPDQAAELARLLRAGPSLRLLTIDTQCRALSTVEPDLLAAGLSSLVRLALSAPLTTEQLTALCSHTSRNLRELDLTGTDLSAVPAAALATAVSDLQSCNLSRTRLTTSQVEQILKAVVAAQKLQRLNITDNCLGGVAGLVLAAAAARLTWLGLSGCQLDSQQVGTVLSRLAGQHVNTSFLNVENNNTKEISAELISEVTKKKIVVKMKKTGKQKQKQSYCCHCGKGPFLRLRVHKCRL